MDLWWALGGVVAGIPIGTALRIIVFRHAVPEGLREACGACGLARRGVVRCGHCGARFGPPLVLEVTTAAVLALLLGRFAGTWEAAAYAFLGVLGVALAAVDLAVQRLPDRLTLPAYPALAALLAVAAVTGTDLGLFGRAMVGGLALAAGYYVLAVIAPGQLGGGDIKLAGLLGMALGWLGWPALIAGTAAAYVLFGLTAVGLLATRRISLRSHVAFGPFMLGGALLAAVAF